MMDAVARDKLLVRELKGMELQLKALDMTPQECLSEEQLQVIIGKYTTWLQSYATPL